MTGQIKTPYYIIHEDKLRRNLELISHVSEQSGAKIIMAFKANALWKTFGIIRDYCQASTASSLNEMRLSLEFLGNDVHAYCPVYTDATIGEFVEGCSHIVFNSVAQYEKYRGFVDGYNASNAAEKRVSCGLRVNPECSVIETDIYNPCKPGSRFGVTRDVLGDVLPEGLEGLHFHCLCESTSYDLEKVLAAFEERFGEFLPRLKWVNMGGGHLMTRKDYDTEHLIKLLQGLKARYPHLEIILEPGSAFTWQTGPLVASVVDIVENRGIKTAILDVSFTCHMPDCLEMPYQPAVRGAKTLPVDAIKTALTEENVYRLGGNSCLSGDYMGSWRFDHPLQIGERIVLEDMIHYTMVKTNMFNGIHHPSIAIWHIDNTLEVYKDFRYEDYRDRMS